MAVVEGSQGWVREAVRVAAAVVVAALFPAADQIVFFLDLCFAQFKCSFSPQQPPFVLSEGGGGM